MGHIHDKSHSHAAGTGKEGKGHGHHHNISITAGRAFKWGIGLNLLFVAAEFLCGYLSNSVGLISDAGHNLSDVASMALALTACILATRQTSSRYTYGYKKSTILVSVANAVILLIAVTVIIAESISKIIEPEEIKGDWIIIVAGIGVLINGFTTWLFTKDKGKDLNIKATYMHMLADTLVSAGVIISGIAIRFTGWSIIDPIVGIVIAIVILVSTWSLLKDSVRLALDAAPEQFDVNEITAMMNAERGVEEVHHVHIWAISTTEYAITAHIVIHDASVMTEVKERLKKLLGEAGIAHSTLEFEDCAHKCSNCGCGGPQQSGI
ncbi:MAG: cation diffusion facilitator family transporter [Bacteroidales bacterium]|nr:cation diffusion facilitator family transporter [Bacteroidales bacterium]